MLNRKPYNLLRSQLKTLDIVVFSGSGFVSNAIKFFTKSEWSHCGMVVRDEATDTVLVWESTTLNSTKGVQVNLLSDRVKDYKGKVAFNMFGIELTPSEKIQIGQIRKRFANTPYERSVLELAFSALDFVNIVKGEDLSSLFCSELNAHVLKNLGYLKGGKPSNEYTPDDMSKIEVVQLPKVFC